MQPAIGQMIDVSHNNGVINWNKVPAGFSFGIKATQSDNFHDPQYANNSLGAKSRGFNFLAYHFYNSSVDPLAQANFFLSFIRSCPAQPAGVALDFEDTHDSKLGNESIIFLRALSQHFPTTQILFYSGLSRIHDLKLSAEFSQYKLWIADYNPEMPNCPAPWSQIHAWQNSSSFVADGIGHCDHSYVYT